MSFAFSFRIADKPASVSASTRSSLQRARATLLAAALVPVVACSLAGAQQGSTAIRSGALYGHVHDPLGALVPGAQVTLLADGQPVTTVTSGAEGGFRFALTAAGRYSVRVSAPGFQTTTSAAEYVKAQTGVEVTLATATGSDEVTVTASGTPTPESQTGAVVTVLDDQDYRFMLEVQDPLRLVPGLQVTQTGQMGGTTGLSIRGGATDANKVLIDGIPANQIGGAVEFANLATVGVQSVEVLNEPDSVLYGADAMAGVVNLTTTRAPATARPLFTYAGDAGNFQTYRNDGTASTVFRQFDLFSEYGRVQTSNNLPNSEFHNGTYAGNFGWTPNGQNDVRFIVRHIDVSGGQPNAIALYGIPDDAQQQEQDLYLNGAWNNQTTARWHNLIRYGYVRLHGEYNDFGATGIYDPSTTYYDGAPVTITGGNGYSVSGQALFQYSNVASSYLEQNRDSSIYAQTDYRWSPHFMALGAFRYEAESGAAFYQGSPTAGLGRGNYDYSLEFSGDVKNRLFYTAGTGLENNGLYGFAGTPRASLAWYPLRPTTSGLFTGTKLHGTFGKGIKEPSVYQQLNSFAGLLSAPGNATIAGTLGNVGPLGPENSRTFDGGLDEELLNGRARVGATYFHDEFTNGVEYVPQSELTTLGLAAANDAPITNAGGAYINSLAFRSQGVEVTAEAKLARGLFARGGYTYTDAVVQHSFSSDNAGPSLNSSSNFSTIPIGAFSPLVGARPFRVAPNTGFFAVTYTRPRFYASLTGTLVSRRDDSDFLTDSDFGTSLLLPNHNLDGGYQRLELGGGYQVTPRINVYTNIQNLLSEHYFEAFGFPALPFTFRSGIKVNFGGESWSLR